jgi:hypothetical protein
LAQIIRTSIASLKLRTAIMGCTHSTIIPSNVNLASADHSETKLPCLLDHINGQGAATVYPAANIDGGDGNTYGIRISGSKINCLDNSKAFQETAFTVECGEHYPGYTVVLLDADKNIVAIMIPLYRPGRPTIKIYTLKPTFEGQEPSKYQKPLEEGSLYPGPSGARITSLAV